MRESTVGRGFFDFNIVSSAKKLGQQLSLVSASTSSRATKKEEISDSETVLSFDYPTVDSLLLKILIIEILTIVEILSTCFRFQSMVTIVVKKEKNSKKKKKRKKNKNKIKNK